MIIKQTFCINTLVKFILSSKMQMHNNLPNTAQTALSSKTAVIDDIDVSLNVKYPSSFNLKNYKPELHIGWLREGEGSIYSLS